MDIDVMRRDNKTILFLKGRFDFQGHQRFRQVMDELTASGQSSLTVDLSGVSFIDSSALGLLLLARESCERVGGNVTLTRPQEYVDRVLKLCQFDGLFHIER